MRVLLLLLITLTQTALAKPPSFWARASSSKREGLIALQEAQHAYRREQFQEAREKARLAREKAPSLEADYVYGLSLFRGNLSGAVVGVRCEETLTLLQSVRARSAALGGEPDLHLALGLCAAVRGEYDLAIEENSLLAYHPAAKPVMKFLGFMNLGDSFMAAGRLEEAISAYQEAYQRASSEPYVSFALAVALYRNNETNAAASAIQRALSMDPYYQSLEDPAIIFVPEEDKLFFLAVAAAGKQETALAHGYLGEYLSVVPEGAYRSVAMEAFFDVEAFSFRLNQTIY